MASEEDVRVAEFLAGRYAVGPAQRQAAAEIATAITTARAETWEKAIMSVNIADIGDAAGADATYKIGKMLEAAAGSSEAEEK